MIYYAKPNGKNEKDGSSLNKAGNFLTLLEKLKPGDTLLLLKGTYNFNHQITINLNGTKENNITISAFDVADKPVFDFRMQPYGNRSDMDCNGFRLMGEYIHFKGIVVAYAGFKGIRSELSNSILENIEVYGACDSGIHMCSGGNNTLINCVSHDNFGYRTIDYGLVKFGYDSDGISDKLHYGKPNTFINCKSYNNTDDGFDFFGRCTEESTMVKNCSSYNNGVSLFDMTNYPRYEVDKEWFDQFKGEGKEMKCINGKTMHITLTEYPAFGNGNGFKLSGKRRYHCIELHDCEANNNKLKGFDQNHNSGIMKLYNCKAKFNGLYDFGFSEEYCGDAYFENCIGTNNNIVCKTYNFNNC